MGAGGRAQAQESSSSVQNPERATASESLDLVWNKFILTMTPAGKASNVVEGEESQRGDTLEWCHA